jgi:DNA-binding response OmpR family regulator
MMEPKTLHVLLVGDTPNLRATMRDIHKAKGFEPISVKTGASAVAQAGTADIDVALIDIHLDGIPGFGVAGLD